MGGNIVVRSVCKGLKEYNKLTKWTYFEIISRLPTILETFISVNIR